MYFYDKEDNLRLLESEEVFDLNNQSEMKRRIFKDTGVTVKSFVAGVVDTNGELA